MKRWIHRSLLTAFAAAGLAGCDYQEPGGVKVEAPGVDIKTGPGGARVDAPGVKIDADRSGVTVDTPDADIKAGPGGAAVKTEP